MSICQNSEPQLVSLIPDNKRRLARTKIFKNSAYACKECIQILMTAHNMAFARRDRPLPSRQCGRAYHLWKWALQSDV
jgi:hypothetical protein